MNVVTSAPDVLINGIRPEQQARYERLLQALEKATSDERREAINAWIQKLQEI